MNKKYKTKKYKKTKISKYRKNSKTKKYRGGGKEGKSEPRSAKAEPKSILKSDTSTRKNIRPIRIDESLNTLVEFESEEPEELEEGEIDESKIDLSIPECSRPPSFFPCRKKNGTFDNMDEYLEYIDDLDYRNESTNYKPKRLHYNQIRRELSRTDMNAKKIPQQYRLYYPDGTIDDVRNRII